MTIVNAKKTEMSAFAEGIFRHKYSMNGTEEWEDTAARVVENVFAPYFPEKAERMTQIIAERKFMPGGRYLYAAGRPIHQVNNCLLMSAKDSREGWAELLSNVTMGLTTGAGIGVNYTNIRHNGAKIGGMGGEATGPLSLMHMVNEIGRHIRQGGSRRSALYASLHWYHPDIFDFIALKDWTEETKRGKEKDFDFPAPMDGTNISVALDDEFFKAMEDPNFSQVYYIGDSKIPVVVDHAHAVKVYEMTVSHMLDTAEPGFQIDTGENKNEILRNACTELTSEDDSDICNLGSINLSNITDLEEFKEVVDLGTAFLLAGTLYSMTPYEKVNTVREKNRRLGLGLMGIYEWLITRGYTYDPNDEFATWLDEYAKSTEIAARYADQLGISRPVKTRAIAPTGTISIISESTSGIEPLFAPAFIRRYNKNNKWHYRYVIDAAAQRLVEKGIDPDAIETAYDLAKTPERRIAFQAWIQQWVDHAISSTLNLPSEKEQEFTHQEFGNMLLKYLPNLRGMTCYPDEARGGQPLSVCTYAEAVEHGDGEFEEFSNEEACVSGVCGI